MATLRTGRGLHNRRRTAPMLAPWVTDELRTADLRDERLNKRLNIILSHFSARPNVSIPAACGGASETNAAYRFFDNDKVDFRSVLCPHLDCTRVRIAAQPVALVVPDRSEERRVGKECMSKWSPIA